MLFSLDVTADNPAGHWHGLSSPDPANRQGAPSNSTTLLNMISQRFTSTKPPPSRESRSEGTRSNVSPCASSTNLTIGDGEDEPEPIENPQATETASIKPPDKRTTRSKTKTSFQLAHPPRNARHERLRIRPKLLLQLQQISQTARPVPTLDVLPSSVLPPKIGGKFPSMLRGKDRVGPNDLVVVTSESYRQSHTEEDANSFSSDDDPDGHREVVATICPSRKEEARINGKAEISLHRGLTWEATLLPNGSYDFVAVNEHGLQTTVRWAQRSKNSRRTSGALAVPTSADDSKRFTFSIMDPTTRRHPVLASMTKNSIDVLDRYPTSSGTNPGASVDKQPHSTTPPEGSIGPPDPPQAVTVGTDDNLRALIVVTGIWVAFREGWSNLWMGCLPSPASPTASRTPVSSIGDHDKEGQTNLAAKESPRSSFHTVRTKLLHKPHASSTTESSMLTVPEAEPAQETPHTQLGRLSISTAGHTNPGNSQPASPNISGPVPRVGNIPESSQNATNENEDGREPSLLKNDNDDDDNASHDNRSRSNTHPPVTEKSKGKRWRRFSSMLDSMGRKDKSGHIS